MVTVEKKKVKLVLEGVDDEAFYLYVLGAFSNAARAEGWTWDEVQVVTQQAMKGKTQQELLTTIRGYCENGGHKN